VLYVYNTLKNIVSLALLIIITRKLESILIVTIQKAWGQ